MGNCMHAKSVAASATMMKDVKSSTQAMRWDATYTLTHTQHTHQSPHFILLRFRLNYIHSVHLQRNGVRYAVILVFHWTHHVHIYVCNVFHTIPYESLSRPHSLCTFPLNYYSFIIIIIILVVSFWWNRMWRWICRWNSSVCCIFHFRIGLSHCRCRGKWHQLFRDVRVKAMRTSFSNHNFHKLQLFKSFLQKFLERHCRRCSNVRIVPSSCMCMGNDMARSQVAYELSHWKIMDQVVAITATKLEEVSTQKSFN